MLYCDECAKKMGYPKTEFQSNGACEICRDVAVCNDTPSRLLPKPKIKKDKRIG